MILDPVCRYGHGAMIKIDPGPDMYWGLFGVSISRAKAGEARAGDPLTELVPNGLVFTLTAFKCTKCGYMELFDEGANLE